jgi:FkbM family methyltransferase
MRSLAAKVVTTVCSRLIYLLHSRNTFPFTREELRLVEFSFSECGEDLAVVRLANQFGLKSGVYVDAGAFQPVLLSNTLLLYKRGWRGINIDLQEDVIAEFRNCRRRDHNVAACLSDSESAVRVAYYAAGNLNRVLPADDQDERSLIGSAPMRVTKTPTTTLTRIIEQSPFRLEQIDYLNIDCEGHDFTVLRGLDLTRCRPRILTIEAFTEEERRTIAEFLAPHGYRLDQFLARTAIFVLPS